MRSGVRPALFLAVLLCAVPVFAQGCAVCYTQAASSGARFISALRSGILVLVIPPMFMSLGIAWLAHRKRNTFRPDAMVEEQIEPIQNSFDE